MIVYLIFLFFGLFHCPCNEVLKFIYNVIKLMWLYIYYSRLPLIFFFIILQQSDGGLYVCSVKNDAARVTANFTLRVQGIKLIKVILLYVRWIDWISNVIWNNVVYVQRNCLWYFTTLFYSKQDGCSGSLKLNGYL